MVVATPHPRAKRVVIALARHVEHNRPFRSPGLDRQLVEALCAGARAEDAENLAVRRKAEPCPRLRPWHRPRTRGDRPPDDQVLGRPVPVELIGEEDSLGERRGEPVGETEMRVRLRQRRREPHRRSGDNHRPGDEAARAEDDVGPPPLQDPAAFANGAARANDRAHELEARAARQRRDPERVELEPGLGNEARLNAIRRPGERHGGSAVAKRLADCDRRKHVSGCSSCCDQAPGRSLLGHGRPRC